MKNFRILAVLTLSAVLCAACGTKAKVEGTLSGACEREVVVQLLDVNKYVVLDTLKTDRYGRYSCRLDIKKGQPEFVYLFYGDRKVASLLLQAGDKVRVTSDTLGSCSVTGSEETTKLLQVERLEEEFASKMAGLSARLSDLDDNSEASLEIRKQLTSSYIEYYRDRVKYVITNPYSLTVVPVLYQSVNGNMPVFSQVTDAIHFMNASDSLKTVYPESRYVKALADEALRRRNILDLNSKFSAASAIGYMDLELPDISGNKIKISDILGKVTMVYFWTSDDAEIKMYNLDGLKPLYEKYHSKGLEIYSVCITTDKALWAGSVKAQDLPWTNVCDGKGGYSPAVETYNVTALPLAFFIVDGELTGDAPVSDDKSIKQTLQKYLK